MSETILSKASRGLSSSLRFTGSSTGPPGIDLSRASTPVNDLTQYARYGSALMFNQLQDGWFTASFSQLTTEAGFVTVTELWDTQVSGAFGIALNSLSGMTCWIYSISIQANANTAVADIGSSRVAVGTEVGIGPGSRASQALWLNDGAIGSHFISIAANSLNLVNMTHFLTPFPWAPGADLVFRIEQVGVNPREVD